MAWTDLPATQTTDWSKRSFLDQFRQAVRERSEIAGAAGDVPSGSTTAITLGADVQHKDTVAAMQGVIEQICTHFVRLAEVDTDDLTINTTADANNDSLAEQAIDAGWLYTWTTLKADAGLHADGWTRKYPDGMGGVTTAYGRMEAGDYFGPWLWNELRAACDLLKHRLFVESQVQGGQGTGAGWGTFYEVGKMSLAAGMGYYGAEHAGSWATAKANAEAAFAASGALGTQLWEFAQLNRTATRRATLQGSNLPYRFDLNDDGIDDYDATLDAYIYSAKRPLNPGGPIGSEVTVSEYDDNGLGLVEDDWALVANDVAATFVDGVTATQVLAPGHTANPPAWPTTDPAVSGDGHIRGWSSFSWSTPGNSNRVWVFAIATFTLTQ
ncbi:MAG: hypothetical protein AAGA29_05965 [Planctomycetota bacterium]